jgi:hypothetical protein
MGNRYGALPYDRPHILKVDGFYTWDVGRSGRVTLGARVRAQSGTPYTPLGNATVFGYGQLETYILPRGTGRTAFEASADVRVAYARHLTKDVDLELFLELYNPFNNQVQTAVDQNYTNDSVDPIIGGSERDLPYLKPSISQVSGPRGGDPACAGGYFCPHPAVKNLNYGNTSGVASPPSGRLGATLSF